MYIRLLPFKVPHNQSVCILRNYPYQIPLLKILVVGDIFWIQKGSPTITISKNVVLVLVLFVAIRFSIPLTFQ